MNRAILPIFLIVLVDVLGLTIILPLLPFYAEHLGASPTVVGLLISTYAFCQLIAGPILGNLSDHMGRKPLLIVSQAGTFIGFLILAVSNSLWLVFLSRAIDGFTAGNLSLAQAYIADVTQPHERAKSFAVIGIAFGVGFLIGPAISGFLSQYGYTYPILAAAALSFTSIVCTATLLPKVTPHADDGSSGPGGKRLGVFEWNAYVAYFKRPDLGPLLAEFFFFAFSFSMFMSGFALFAERRHHLGPREVGYVFAYAGFLGIIMQGGLVRKMVVWVGERTMAWTGFGVSAISYAAYGFTNTIPQLLAVSTVNSYNSMIRPAVTSMITHKAGRREQGVVLGLTQSLTSVSQIVAPMIVGALIDRGYLTAWAVATGVVALFGMFVSLPRGRENDSPGTTGQSRGPAA